MRVLSLVHIDIYLSRVEMFKRLSFLYSSSRVVVHSQPVLLMR